MKLELPTLLIAAWALRHTCIYLFIYFVSRLLQRTCFLTPLTLSSSLLAFPHTHTSLPVSTSSVIFFFFKLKFLYHQTTKQFSSNLPTDQSTPPPPLPNLHNKIFKKQKKFLKNYAWFWWRTHKRNLKNPMAHLDPNYCSSSLGHSSLLLQPLPFRSLTRKHLQQHQHFHYFAFFFFFFFSSSSSQAKHNDF